MHRAIEVTFYTDEGDEVVLDLPARWEICGDCEGEGKSSAYLGALTEDVRADWHPDELDDYLRGRYDRACECCKGSGRVLTPDLPVCQAEDEKLALRQWQQARKNREQDARTMAGESGFWCGG